jgi:hypothetical protein
MTLTSKPSWETMLCPPDPHSILREHPLPVIPTIPIINDQSPTPDLKPTTKNKTKTKTNKESEDETMSMTSVERQVDELLDLYLHDDRGGEDKDEGDRVGDYSWEGRVEGGEILVDTNKTSDRSSRGGHVTQGGKSAEAGESRSGSGGGQDKPSILVDEAGDTWI